MNTTRDAVRKAMAAIALAASLTVGAAALASAVVVQQGNARLSVSGDIDPARLPRNGTAPIKVSIGSVISATQDHSLPPLKSISIQINRHGRLDTRGLPVCELSQIQPASSSAALDACRPALVGRGRFSGSITLPGSSAYPIEGSLIVFNGRQRGRPVLFAHAFSGKPIATSFVMIFRLSTIARGTFGTQLKADLTKTLGSKRTLSSIEMNLSRSYLAAGRRRSFLSAGCPAPTGARIAVFPLARTSFTLGGGKRLNATVIQTCKVR